jgi:hypothetical protein
MTADIARTSYDPNRPWRAVIPQQGRVTLEADINEQIAIAAETLRRETIELVGPVAIPRPADSSAPGYVVNPTSDGSDVSISPGAIYVGGWRNSLVQTLNSRSQTLSTWLDMPSWPPPTGSLPDGNWIVALLLIEQTVVAVEDQSLLEVALGGPDSAARLAVLQHVLLIPTASGSYSYTESYVQGGPPNPLVAYLAGQGFTYDPATAMLTNNATLQVTTSGYTGPDNQMIRVAISTYDGSVNATLVWGFDNAAFLYRAQGTPSAATGQPLVLTFLNPPLDADHQPQAGLAVEILRCTMSLDGSLDGGKPNVAGNYIAAGCGVVVPLGVGGASYDPSTLQLTLPATSLVTASGVPQPFLADLSRGLPVFVRLWRGQVAFTNNTAVPLGTTGLSVTINLPAGFPALPGPIGNPPFWQFAVRTSTPEQIYPQRYLLAQPPEGPRQAMAILGITQSASGAFKTVNPSSVPFLSLSQMTPPSANPPAFHVTGINWVNDDVMTLDWLILQGLKVTLDNAPSGPLDSRNFLVTLWMPYTGALVANLIFSRGHRSLPLPVALSGPAILNGTTLNWLPSHVTNNVGNLPTIVAELSNTVFQNVFTMEARVVLKGHAIFGTIAAQPAWLDGQCFGVASGLRSDGVTPRIDLNLNAGVASGAGAKASDFESWFSVAPAPVLSVTIAPDTLQLEPGAAVPSVQGSVSLSTLYATPTSSNTAITVSLSSSDANSASCPASIVLQTGPDGSSSAVNFPVSIVTPPGAGTSFTVTFTVTAQLPSTFSLRNSATLTVNGPPVLTLALSPNSIPVPAGETVPVSGTITLSPAPFAATTVSLTSTLTGLVQFPPTVQIAAGSTSIPFAIVVSWPGPNITPAVTFTAELADSTSTSAVLQVIGISP